MFHQLLIFFLLIHVVAALIPYKFKFIGFMGRDGNVIATGTVKAENGNVEVRATLESTFAGMLSASMNVELAGESPQPDTDCGDANGPCQAVVDVTKRAIVTYKLRADDPDSVPFAMFAVNVFNNEHETPRDRCVSKNEPALKYCVCGDAVNQTVMEEELPTKCENVTSNEGVGIPIRFWNTNGDSMNSQGGSNNGKHIKFLYGPRRVNGQQVIVSYFGNTLTPAETNENPIMINFELTNSVIVFNDATCRDEDGKFGCTCPSAVGQAADFKFSKLLSKWGYVWGVVRVFLLETKFHFETISFHRTFTVRPTFRIKFDGIVQDCEYLNADCQLEANNVSDLKTLSVEVWVTNVKTQKQSSVEIGRADMRNGKLIRNPKDCQTSTSDPGSCLCPVNREPERRGDCNYDKMRPKTCADLSPGTRLGQFETGSMEFTFPKNYERPKERQWLYMKPKGGFGRPRGGSLYSIRMEDLPAAQSSDGQYFKHWIDMGPLENQEILNPDVGAELDTEYETNIPADTKVLYHLYATCWINSRTNSFLHCGCCKPDATDDICKKFPDSAAPEPNPAPGIDEVVEEKRTSTSEATTEVMTTSSSSQSTATATEPTTSSTMPTTSELSTLTFSTTTATESTTTPESTTTEVAPIMETSSTTAQSTTETTSITATATPTQSTTISTTVTSTDSTTSTATKGSTTQTITAESTTAESTTETTSTTPTTSQKFPDSTAPEPTPAPGPDGPTPTPKPTTSTTTTTTTTTKPTTTTTTKAEEPEPPKTTTTEAAKPNRRKGCNEVETEKDKKLCKMAETKVSPKNVETVISNVKTAFQPEAASADTVTFVAELVRDIAAVPLTPTQRVDVLQLVDSALGADANTFGSAADGTSTHFVRAIEQIASKAEEFSYFGGKELAVHKPKIQCGNGDWSGIMDTDDGFQSADDSNSKGKASIQLATSGLCDEEGKAAVPYFVIYRNSKLFNSGTQTNDHTSTQSKRKKRSTEETESTEENRCGKDFHKTNGIILSSVLPQNQEAKIDARLRFRKEEFEKPLHSNLVATWWDGSKWATNDQCRLVAEGDEWVAHCDHLTNFALLVQRSESDPLLCDNVLDKLGTGLSIASAVCLGILCVVYATRGIPRIRDNIYVQLLNNSKSSRSDYIVVCNVVATLLFYLAFILFSDQSVLKLNRSGCTLASAALYSLFLWSTVLNVFQAWQLLLHCVSSQSELLLSKLLQWYVVFPVSFFVPILVAVLIGILDSTFFFRDDQFCWISPDAVLTAVIIPVSVMLLNSALCFAFFTANIIPALSFRKQSFVRMSASSQNRSETLQKFLTLFFLQFTLGIPWILQYPASFSSEATVWHWLFAIFNGSYGVMMLLIYIYGRVVAAYKNYRAAGEANSRQPAAAPLPPPPPPSAQIRDRDSDEDSFE